MVIEGN